jgi:hypothetical protein
MTYYTLIGLETEEVVNKVTGKTDKPIKRWVIEFGSHDKEEVDYEKESLNFTDGSYKKLKIIKTKTDLQSEINKAVKKLNEALEDKRLGLGIWY